MPGNLDPQMVRKSFIFVPGIGPKTEQYLWKRGVSSWSDLQTRSLLPDLGKRKRENIKDYVRKGRDALKSRDISFFAENFPPKEYWRLYRDFRDRTLFLDVETTGLSHYYDNITLVGTFDGRESRIFVKDNNLQEFVKVLEDHAILVTFNGKLFDVPFIKKEFPDIALNHVHIDLRFLLRSIGIGGPLKTIEEKFGLQRNGEIVEIDGREAAVLWRKFLKGDDDAFRKLVLYNLSDTRNLKTLMDYCYFKKFERDVLPKLNGAKKRYTLPKSYEDSNSGYARLSGRFAKHKVVLRPKQDYLQIFSNRSFLAQVKKNTIRRPVLRVSPLVKRIQARGRSPVVVGIDLSGSAKRPTGMCVLSGKMASLNTVYTDAEIINRTLASSPSVVSIDSPLSLPRGRTCTRDDCRCRKFGITRGIERTLKSRGINVYPCLIKSMQNLTKRGMELAKKLRKQGNLVIESYPGAAQDILGFPRKRVDMLSLQEDLIDTGIVPLSQDESVNHHELDALTSALVGYFYLADSYEAIGNKEEDYLIIPQPLTTELGPNPETNNAVGRDLQLGFNVVSH